MAQESGAATGEWQSDRTVNFHLQDKQLQQYTCTVRSNAATPRQHACIMESISLCMLNREISDVVLLWRQHHLIYKVRKRAERIMRRVAVRLMNRASSDTILIWRQQCSEEMKRLRAEMIMRRVGFRMRNQLVAVNYFEFRENYRSDIVGVLNTRIKRLQMHLDAVTVKAALGTVSAQSVAGKLMSKIVKRMLSLDVASMLIVWRTSAADMNARQQIMRKVALRLMKRGLSDALLVWHQQYDQARSWLRAQTIIQRIGFRIRNRLVAMNYTEWSLNVRRNSTLTWKTKSEHLQMELDTLKLKAVLSNQSAAVRIGRRMLMRSVMRSVQAWWSQFRAAMAFERGQRTMRRVGLRMMNRALSDCVLTWHERSIEESSRARAVVIMRRVQFRIVHRNVALNYAEWVENYRKTRFETYKKRSISYKQQLHHFIAKGKAYGLPVNFFAGFHL